MSSDTSNDENFKARPYQDQLLETVMEQNSIIYLPTGAGKTFIALMAMKRMSNDLSKSLRNGGKRSAFLVNTVVLANQQVECIRKATALKVAIYTGDQNVDAWRRDRWSEEFENHQVIVATCQIVLDVIRHGFVRLEDFNIIIFDECHHGRKDHPMHQLMSHYRDVPVDKRPRIIGLTGMLIGSSVKPGNVIELLDNLEGTFHAKIATVKSMKEFTNVLLYSTNPIEKLLPYRPTGNPSTNAIIERITKIINKSVEKIEMWPVDITHQRTTSYTMRGELTNATKFLRTIVQDFLYQMNDMGIYGASIAIMSLMVDLELKKRNADSIRLKQLIRVLITDCELIRHILVEELDEEENEEDDDSSILSNASQKLVTLIAYLKHHVNQIDASTMKAIVFVQRRYTAKMIYHILTRYAKSNPAKFNIVPDFMVGANNQIPDSVDTILETKHNRSVVERFRKNEINLIVASSVLEEGIDLQMCNLVLCYDTPNSFRSYVQTKGRARKATSLYTMMVATSEQNKLISKLAEYREVDAILKKYLIGRTIDREGPLVECINRQFEDEQITPFRTRFGAVLEAASAVQLLNRYCSTLPNDTFTVPTVNWKKTVDKAGMIIVAIRLPMQSKVKQEIRSDPMSSLKLAKRSGAFKACVSLYEAGELNENLMPINSKRCIIAVSSQYFKHWDKYKSDHAKMAGTKRNSRLHEIICPSVLMECSPMPREPCYLYTITVRPEFLATKDESSEEFRRLLLSQRTFGILTSKKLPNLARIPLFITLGQIDSTIAANPKEIDNLNDEHLSQLRNFHVMVFRDILNINHSFMANDYANRQNSFFVVPCDGNAIDWSTVRAFQKLEPVQSKTDKERQNMRFQPENYIDKVVKHNNTVYVVTKVLANNTPNSPFPNPNYASFADYNFVRYGRQVQNKNQFLIDVKGVSTSLKQLTPGKNVDGGKNVKPFRITLIPEFCHNYGFPGDLWLKATLLPSTLHRINFLLNAENIRLEVNRYIGIDDTNYKPKPIGVELKGQSLVMQSEEDTQETLDEMLPSKRNIPKQVQLSQGVLACPWTADEEPIDYIRKLQEIHSFDIDYYKYFVDQKIDEVCHILDGMRLGYSSALPVVIPDFDKKKQQIKLLEIDLNTPTMGPEQSDLLSCITEKSTADVFDLERLEVIGDAFLKFGVSLFLLQKHPDWHEGFLSSCKGQMVSNRNLCYIAADRKFGGYMKVAKFNPIDIWSPPLLKVPKEIQMCIEELNVSPHLIYSLKLNPSEMQNGKAETSTALEFLQMLNNVDPMKEGHYSKMFYYIDKQRVSDKSLADCVEAIIGACITSIGIERGFKLLNMLSVFPDSDGDYKQMLRAAYRQPRLRSSIKDQEVDVYLINYSHLEANLGYKFKDRAYLLQALTHPSFPTNLLTGCYQQLEFLGDAVLDMLVTAYIFENCPEKDPGQLTDIRSALVNNITLACLCVRYNFHLHILHQSAILTEKVASFVQYQSAHDHAITDQVLMLFAEGDVLGDFVDVPKTLGDIFEALIGAVFLDSGNSLSQTWAVIYRLMNREIDAFMVKAPLQIVRQLHEFPNAHPVFDPPVVDNDIVMINVQFTCRNELMKAQGFGSNKEDAKRAAAKVAVSILKAK